ncbi:MAG: hypothetical protein IPL19_33940 [Sandaracinaceae bacterium]|nr:hypothetical protein [Sandaracinaceae bacterium]
MYSSVSLPIVATTAIAVRAVPSLTYSACMARRECPDARSSSDDVCMANKAVALIIMSTNRVTSMTRPCSRVTA